MRHKHIELLLLILRLMAIGALIGAPTVARAQMPLCDQCGGPNPPPGKVVGRPAVGRFLSAQEAKCDESFENCEFVDVDIKNGFGKLTFSKVLSGGKQYIDIRWNTELTRCGLTPYRNYAGVIWRGEINTCKFVANGDSYQIFEADRFPTSRDKSYTNSINTIYDVDFSTSHCAFDQRFARMDNDTGVVNYKERKGILKCNLQ